MAEKVLELEDLAVSFDTPQGEVEAVRGVDLCVEQGEILSFKKEDWMKEVYRSNVIEEKDDVLIPDADGIYHVSLREFEIATFGIVR